MRHRVKGFKLNRHSSARTALLKGLVSQLFMHGEITTTATKAKFVQPQIDHFISQAKLGSITARRQIAKTVTQVTILRKLFDEVAPRYVDVVSGFTRITALGRRRGDDAMMVKLSLVEGKALPKVSAAPAVEKAAAKAAKVTGKPVEKQTGSAKKKTVKTEKKPAAKSKTVKK